LSCGFGQALGARPHVCRHLAESYVSFYEVLESGPEAILRSPVSLGVPAEGPPSPHRQHVPGGTGVHRGPFPDRQRIPALGNITPPQASKTEKGRKKLRDLIDFIERSDAAREEHGPKVDFDVLRRMLGLLPKVN